MAFQGHERPGLAIETRAAEVIPHKAGQNDAADLVVDMCAVDATQFLTGATFGKGNLVGKAAKKFAELRRHGVPHPSACRKKLCIPCVGRVGQKLV